MVPNADKRAYHVDIDDVERCVPGIFSKILHSTEVDNLCNDTSYVCDDCCEAMTDKNIANYCRDQSVGSIVGELVDQLVDNADLNTDNTNVIITIRNGVSNDVSSAIAEDYASYMLSAAAKASPECLVTTMLRNLL
jgi:hypothetical protein